MMRMHKRNFDSTYDNQTVTEEKKREDESITFGMGAEEWLLYKSQTLKYSTYVKYRSLYRNHLLMAVGQFKIKEVNEDVLNSKVFHKDGREKILSQNLQNSIINLVNQVITYVNENYGYPFMRLKRKKELKMKLKTVSIFSLGEQKQILKYVYDHRNISGVGILLCLSTGLRLGEICALKWEDIDFINRILYVRRTVQRIEVDNAETKTILMESEPKSFCSIREIPLSQGITELLLTYKDDTVYFMNGNKPMEPRSYQKKFKSILKQAGISDKNFHILRHTFATNCIEGGTDVKSLSEMLGYSNVQITLNRYVHPSMDTKRQCIDKLSIFYGQIYG